MNPEGDTPVEKFAIVGTLSAGKSTVVEVYKRRFVHDPRVAVLDEATQIFFQDNPNIIKGAIHVFAVQRQIQDFVLEREQAAYVPGVQLIICDRSVIDPIVYMHFYHGPDGAQKLYERIAYWIPTYKKFFLLDPSTVPYDNGAFRRESPADRLAVHETFEGFLHEHALPYEVISGSVPERVARMDGSMSQHVSHTIFEGSS